MLRTSAVTMSPSGMSLRFGGLGLAASAAGAPAGAGGCAADGAGAAGFAVAGARSVGADDEQPNERPRPARVAIHARMRGPPGRWRRTSARGDLAWRSAAPGIAS